MREAGQVVAGAAAVVEDHLAVVVAPQAAELAEQRVLREPPLEVRSDARRLRNRFARTVCSVQYWSTAVVIGQSRVLAALR